MSFFGETNYDGPKNKSAFKPYYSIKENVENIFRIAPPCRNLPSGEFAVFHKVHFGYGVPDDMNPDKMRARPFLCIHEIDWKTKKVKVQCPECAKIDVVKAELETLKEKLKLEGHAEDYIKQATSPQVQWLSAHNLDNKWYCYAKNLAGEWNVLKLGHKAKLAMEDRMKRTLKEDSIKALDPSSGVWFKFTKNGLRGPNALTTVEVLKEKVDMGNGVKAEVIKSAPLTEGDEKAISQLVDVTICVTKLNYDQINALVESGGAPEVAKSIFALGTKKEEGTNSQALAGPKASSSVANQAPASPKPEAKPVAAAPKASTKEIAEMNPDTFLRMFANQNKS